MVLALDQAALDQVALDQAALDQGQVAKVQEDLDPVVLAQEQEVLEQGAND